MGGGQMPKKNLFKARCTFFLVPLKIFLCMGYFFWRNCNVKSRNLKPINPSLQSTIPLLDTLWTVLCISIRYMCTILKGIKKIYFSVFQSNFLMFLIRCNYYFFLKHEEIFWKLLLKQKKKVIDRTIKYRSN